ncbi:hypothetical protein Ade02nite_19600 [Paractinoplanes deccanensis]|uniref:Uncharacterized protein n=1 Tax=Paractinoplanes deccanensis TaxID=113561 RepID=A0ABQ3Y010_9ACTN|nr:hypothetical protein [Actinoplanes deccanensis]GID73319.1 hypothetical protein Ade02nite_19600 [Actinoplanes deccanensis]
MDSLWDVLRDRLGLDHIHEHQQRQEKTMAKLSDELADISRRQEAIRDAITTSGENLRGEIDKLNTQIEELRNGDLDADAQAKVDEIKATADNLRTAAEGLDDGFEPPVVEPTPFPPGDDGSVGSGERGAI